MSYSEKLQSPLWQKRRLEILQRDNFSCQLCGDTQTTLHVHHKEYISGREPWDYEDDNFQTLCKDCHLITEFFKKKQGIVITCQKAKYDGSIWFSVITNNHFGLKYISLCLDTDSGKIKCDTIIYQSELESIIRDFESAEKLLADGPTA